MAIASPTDLVNSTLSLLVKVLGTIIPDYYPLISVDVHHQINRISSATLIFTDGVMNASRTPITDNDSFVPGNKIEILAGYGIGDELSIFSGLIVKQGIAISADGFFRLTLSCKHEAVGMTFNRKDVEFTDLSDAEILTRIIQGNQLNGEVASTSVIQETVTQKGATDWDFLLSRAEFYGFLVTCEKGNTVEIAAPNLSAEPVLRLTLGESILSFNAELDAQRQASELEASAWANASLLRMRLSALKGSVSFQGNGTVLPGKMVLLEGVGARYNGNAFVSSVNHQIADGSWKTTVEFGLDDLPIAEQGNFNSLPVAGQLPAISGLQIATVKNLFEDPQSLHRIQLTINSSAENQTGTWARVSNFYATADAGSGFLPEVGDEVVVGFVDSNPRYPIVIGSLYSSLKAPAHPAKDNNNFIKSIVTKGKLKISFDDEKKVMTLETPAGNVVTLDDENKKTVISDQNGNVITMDPSGISMLSNKDISLKAKGDISLEAEGKIALGAKNDVVVSGLNVTNVALNGFTAAGGATAELKASGQTTVKGGIVMIN